MVRVVRRRYPKTNRSVELRHERTNAADSHHILPAEQRLCPETGENEDLAVSKR